MTVQAFQQIRPCIDGSGHTFTHSEVAAGNWGEVFVYCIRCGRMRSELNPVPPESKAAK